MVDKAGETGQDTSQDSDKAPEGDPTLAPPENFSLEQVYGFAELVSKDKSGRVSKADSVNKELSETNEGLQKRLTDNESALKEQRDRLDRQEEESFKGDPEALSRLKSTRDLRSQRDDQDRRETDLKRREASVTEGAVANEKRGREIDLKDVATSRGVDITALEALAPQGRESMERIADLMKGGGATPQDKPPEQPTTIPDSGKSQGGGMYTREQLSKMPMSEYSKIPKERRDA